jgi:hypothetical protein
MGDPAVEVSALQWSATAMSETTERFARLRAWDRPRGFALVGEGVWWVTIVDATLVRHHQEVYDGVLGGLAPAERRAIEKTLAGLRFLRNQIGNGADLAEFVESGASGPGAGAGRVTGWTWKPVAGPALASTPPRGQGWEMTRYRAYQDQLAGSTIGEVFGRAVAFLTLTAAKANPIRDVIEQTAP